MANVLNVREGNLFPLLEFLRRSMKGSNEGEYEGEGV